MTTTVANRNTEVREFADGHNFPTKFDHPGLDFLQPFLRSSVVPLLLSDSFCGHTLGGSPDFTYHRRP